MDAEKYRRSIAPMCPTCGHKDFERDGEDHAPLRCVRCDRRLTREELIRENGEVIAVQVDEVKAEVMEDVTQEMRSVFKKAFRGSKHIRFK